MKGFWKSTGTVLLIFLCPSVIIPLAIGSLFLGDDEKDNKDEGDEKRDDDAK